MASPVGHSGSDGRDITGDRAGSLEVDSYGTGGSLSWIGINEGFSLAPNGQTS
jgi:hypothetical protein